MSRALLDLSSRPFVNRRPVVRLSLLLWLTGGLLLAGNVWLYWDFIAGRGNLHAQLRDVNERIETEERQIAALSEELSSFDLEAQNRQVRYLNRRIDQRRFSWSRLFDELSELLPRDVRLTSLAPSAGEEDPGSRRRRSQATASIGSGRVLLDIEADAREDQAILDLVDALFADPSFERPNLLLQRRDETGAISFELVVFYTPESEREGPGQESLDAEVLPADGAAVEPASEADDSPPPATLGRPASSPPELS